MEWLYSRRVFSADLMKEQPVAALVNETYRVLSEGVNSSITQEVPKELTNNLRENTFRFSGFKTYHQMKEASLLLEDKKGGFKSYESFQRDVLSIDNRYNRQYLEAEYNFAVQSTQMAVKWKDFEKDGNDYNLQYRTANDGRVREEHAVLHGTTLPVDDPFWDKYYPPLGWNCRCTVVQVRKNKYDVSNSQEAIAAGGRATAKPKQQIFRFNPGKTKNVFPPKHPYMPKGCGNCTRGLHLAYNANSEQCKACGKIKECMDDLFGKKIVIARYDNGGIVEAYTTIDTTKNDYQNVLSVAKAFASNGSKVVMTPKFDYTRDCDEYKNIYGSLMGTPYQGKCPDLLIDDKWYEHEGFITSNTKRAFSNMIARGLEQSDRIIVEDCGLNDGYMLRSINSRIIQGKDIKEVWIHTDDRIRVLYKKTEGQ